MATKPFASPYSPNTDDDRRMMLEAIGVSSVDELFLDIPSQYFNPELRLPEPRSEFDLRRDIEKIASANKIPGDYASFLGAGSYRHYIPAVVRPVVTRGEFLTSYTPYQPEVAQGTLQTTYEFQTLVCQLTGMEVANAGMYDGSTSLAEAALMAARITKFNKIAVLDTLSPYYRQVLDTYVQAPGIQIDEISSSDAEIDEGTACLIVQQPNFFGYMEDLGDLADKAHSQGALLVVYADPVSLGMFKPPGAYGADIVVAEGQSFGVPPSFGGPYVGMFACKSEHLRQMPGRIVGKTVDTNGETGYVLTLQAREQHIRRERATSNICTSVALIALMSTVYMSALGKRGIRHIAELCYHKAHYLASEITKIPGFSIPIEGMFFREFVIQCPMPPAEINERLLEYGIIGGLDVSTQIQRGMMLCATEMNTREEIDALVNALSEIGGSA